MKVTKLKASGRDYDTGTLHATTQGIFDLRVKLVSSCSLKEEKTLDKLTGFHRDRFRQLWGPPSFCWQGNHYFYCWLLNLDDKATILVFTAKEHGTEYELVNRLNGKPVSNHLPTVKKFFKEVVCK
jgi:hypothetical protein